MNIKSIVEKTMVDSGIDFPCLMESDNGNIVLMSDEKTGILVAKEANSSSYLSLGNCYSTWDICSLKPFYGSVTITSSKDKK